jgi:hypothetical protein
MAATSHPEPGSGPQGGDGALQEHEEERAQALFREVNEQIRRASDGFSGDGHGALELELLCECSDPACLQRLVASAEEYEAVRRFPTRFLVRPGHFSPANERVVDETAAFVVVEKFGPDAQLAIELDPRRRTLRLRRAGA